MYFRLTYEDGFKKDVVKRFQYSGLSKRMFARLVGIPESTLRQWIKELSLSDDTNLITIKAVMVRVNRLDERLRSLERKCQTTQQLLHDLLLYYQLN